MTHHNYVADHPVFHLSFLCKTHLVMLQEKIHFCFNDDTKLLQSTDTFSIKG